MVYYGDKVLDPLVMVNDEVYIGEDNPETMKIRKWKRLRVCLKSFFKIPSKVFKMVTR